jgi:hypothetical protein
VVRALTIVVMLLSMGSIFAQHRIFVPEDTTAYNFSNIDPKNIDRQKLWEKIRRNNDRIDSMFRAMKQDSLYQLNSYLDWSPNDYASMSYVFDLVNVDYGRLREELISEGFDDIGETSVLPSIGLGITGRLKRWFIEYSLNIFIGHKKTSDGKSVKIDGANLLNFYLGYDILNTRRVALYPLVGISQQFTDIHLKREPSSTSTLSSVFAVEEEYTNLRIRRNSWRVGPALELDFRLGNPKVRNGAVIGIRYGLSYTFHQGAYKVNRNEIDYDPKLDVRGSYFSLIAKLF